MTQLRDSFSIKPAEIDGARAMLAGMVKDLTDRFPKMKKPDASQSTSTTQPPTSTQTSTAPSAPLNATNLQQQQQQLKMHSRSGSKSSHPPAAPTSAQPPFPFGATSPHGQLPISANLVLPRTTWLFPRRRGRSQIRLQSKDKVPQARMPLHKLANLVLRNQEDNLPLKRNRSRSHRDCALIRNVSATLLGLIARKR